MRVAFVDPEAKSPSIRGNGIPIGSGTTSARIPRAGFMQFLCHRVPKWAVGI